LSIRKTFFDTMAMSSVGVVRLLAQFLTIPIMARLLSPEDYGVVAMAMPFLVFSMMIADAGIATSLVRTSTDDSKEWSTCFWLSVMLGLILAVIMLVSAPFIAMLFEEPKLSPIIMVLAAIVLIQSIGAVYNSALQKSQKFKFLAGIEAAAILGGITTAIVSAINGCGVWSLVFQQLAYYIIKIGAVLAYSPFKPVKQFDIKSVGEHIRFGKDILANYMINFFTRSIDNLIIGKALDAAAVGVYSMAFQFARLPWMLVAGPLQSIFYTKMAKAKDDIEYIRKTFLILTRILATTIFPTMGMVAVAHQAVYTIMLSAKWQESGKLFMMVAGVTSLQAVMNGMCSTVFLALGKTRQQVRQTSEQGFFWIITISSTVWFGLDYLVIGYSVMFLCYSPRILMLTLPLINCSYKDYFKAIIIPILVTFVCIATFIILQSMFDMSNLIQLFTTIILIGIGVTVSGLLQYPIFLNEYKLMKNPAPKATTDIPNI
jgi:O-antigen/teichoic acid export membrane protein